MKVIALITVLHISKLLSASPASEKDPSKRRSLGKLYEAAVAMGDMEQIIQKRQKRQKRQKTKEP